MTAPVLLHIPGTETTPTAVTVCCGGSLDDGRCDRCEFIPPQVTDQVCTTCDEFVVNPSPEGATTLECLTCGARWSDVTVDLSSAALDGVAADGWNPAKAPVSVTQYLDIYTRAA